MQVRLNEIESGVLGRPVLEILDAGDDDDFARAEEAWIREHRPEYVVCKIPVEQLRAAHRLEELGFRFIEAQMRLTWGLRRDHDIAGTRYRFEEVVTEPALQDVLAIARETFTDDRWLVDPYFPDARRAAGLRYEAYVRESFRRPDEKLYRLFDPESGTTLAFKTHRLLGNGEALMLLGGVHPDYKGAGLGPLAAYHEYNELRRQGVRRITTHVSARNYPVLNLEVGALRYRITQTFTVLRKVYPS